jgi:hypothetical protein
MRSPRFAVTAAEVDGAISERVVRSRPWVQNKTRSPPLEIAREMEMLTPARDRRPLGLELRDRRTGRNGRSPIIFSALLEKFQPLCYYEDNGKGAAIYIGFPL